MRGQEVYRQQDTHRASCRLLLRELRQHPLMCSHASMQVRAQDVYCDRHASEPALSQREFLPSAPPLPDSGASTSYSQGSPASQHVQYPSLQACHGERAHADSQSSRRSAEPERERVSQGINTSASSQGTHGAQQKDSAHRESPEHPAGALAWAMEATAGVTDAALAALSARLPWHQHGHSSQDEAQQGRQQTRQGASQGPSRIRRC